MFPIDRRTALSQAAVCAFAPWSRALEQDPKPKVDPYADAVLVDGEPPLPGQGSFTVVVLPDTQHYSEKYPQHFQKQTEWIVANKRSRNIAAVMHLGDITNRNTQAEWMNATHAMKVLDGHVPYFMTTGNHDYSEGGGCKDRNTGFKTHFPVAMFKDRPTFGGVYDREPDSMVNNYGLFSSGGREFLVIALEFGPRRDVVRWANEVAAKYKDREAILVTHAFIYSDDTRYNWKKYGTKQTWNPHNYAVAKSTNDDVLDGEELWNQLISKNENFILTMNGHVLNDGLGKVISSTPGKRSVTQFLVNFQMKPRGGDGWLRLLEFKSDRKTVEVHDYSPLRNQRNESAQNRFALTIAPVAK